MLRGLSNVRRRVEQLATQAGSGRCNGYYRRHRVVHVSNDDPTPPWPDGDTGGRCVCGAEMELRTIVHQHVPDDRPDMEEGEELNHRNRLLSLITIVSLLLATGRVGLSGLFLFLFLKTTRTQRTPCHQLSRCQV